ncbi:MAG: family 1 glycosylhydrolase [Lachnospiraceae bacterium]|nr:family 1 glycosylhydrolase [Lachnospiraceae bacterium]
MGFPKDFMWGAAAASYQIEGAYNEDGKGLNIWDVYSRELNYVRYRETGDVACDHYHRMKEDVAMMKEMGLKVYRFSISWSRVIPNGIGEVNQKGLQFYSDLVDELIQNGIEPMVTLYHWDYPYELHKQGAWMNPDSSDWFLEYTKVIVDSLSDRVQYWGTINEPQCFLGCGYYGASHAPFLKRPTRDLLIIGRNILLSHGKSARYIRQNAKKKPIIGFSPIGPCNIPKDSSKEAIEEAKRLTFSTNGEGFVFSQSYWSDPIFFGKYPQELYDDFGDLVPEFTKEEWSFVTEPLDYYGANIYYSNANNNVVGYPENWKQGIAHTQVGWVVSPEVLYWSAKFLYERYGKPIFITENGMAEHDWVCLDGKVHDTYRIDYTHRYLKEYKRAGEEGVPLMGYLHWSVMDNFEWALGYNPRFGLVYVDYATQERILKDSAYWYKSVIESNGENL